MYARSLVAPNHSFFLFGPRATGKTTWLKGALPNSFWINLNRTKEFLELVRDPDLFRNKVLALPKDTWIVIDEVQKLPSILNEVQNLMTDFKGKYKFALSGSSARKLKRLDVNLLAGRAINRQMFPLTTKELEYKFDLDFILQYGTLPDVCMHPENKIDILEAYSSNYIKEEIQQEALTKDIESFSRFLEIASIVNGQVLNISNIARDAGIQRPTAKRYFDILADTLIGRWVPAWRPKAKVKEIAHPKFYMFDCGVVRALGGRLYDPLDSSEKGSQFETVVFHELNSYMSYYNTGGSLSYWSTPLKNEIDFIWSRSKKAIGFEVKHSISWRNEYAETLNHFIKEGILESGYVIYRGESKVKANKVVGLPFNDFVKELNSGKIIS